MNNLKPLIKTTLVGTSKSTFKPLDVKELQKLGLEPDQLSEFDLLTLAAVYSKWKKAGFKPTVFQNPLPEKCRVDLLPVCTPKSTQHLKSILSGKYEKALPEYLDYTFKHERRIPEECLADLLNMGLKRFDYQPRITKVIGEKGKWLATQNVKWHYALTDYLADGWTTKKIKEVVPYLMRLRKENPEQALSEIKRELSSWKAKDKPKLLICLAINKSPNDAPYLESLLDHKLKDVREVASTLLVHIKASALNERIEAQFKQYLNINHQTDQLPTLSFDFPETLPDSLLRDGIVPVHPKSKKGQKAQWLLQFVERIHPDFWSTTLEISPTNVLKVFLQSEWQEVFLEGLITTISTHKPNEWKYALLNFWVENRHQSIWKVLDINPLLGILNQDEFNKLAQSILKRSSSLLNAKPDLHHLFTSNTHQWEDKTARLFIHQFKEDLAKETLLYWSTYGFRKVLFHTAYYINPELLGVLSGNWPEGTRLYQSWGKDVDAFLGVLGFRKRMGEEFITFDK